MKPVPKKVMVNVEAFEYEGQTFLTMEDFDKYIEKQKDAEIKQEIIRTLTEDEEQLVLGSIYKWLSSVLIKEYPTKYLSAKVDLAYAHNLSQGYGLSEKGEKLNKLFNLLGYDLTYSSDVEGRNTSFTVKKLDETEVTLEELETTIQDIKNRNYVKYI